MESPHMSENLFNADIEIGQFVILKHIKNEASYLSRTEASEHSEVLSILRLENHGKVLIVSLEPISPCLNDRVFLRSLQWDHITW